MALYKYGMRLRGFSIGCQPMAGLVDWCDCDGGDYYSILTYSRPLADDEIANYSLSAIYQTDTTGHRAGKETT